MNIINNYDLFLFDLDNTLVDTEKYHYLIWLEILREYKGNDFIFNYEYFCSKFQSEDVDLIKDYLVNELKLNDYENILKCKNEKYYDFIIKNKDKINMIDGAKEYLELILDNNKKFVIVTNSSLKILNYFLELFPILKNSKKNYYRELFLIRKPSPNCYLMVKEDFINYKKIAFEDSLAGIVSLDRSNEKNNKDNIDIILVNNKDYYFYNKIIQNYKIKKSIKNFIELI